MKAATAQELKQELSRQSPARLLELCQRLIRFKKENKELLTYLLFDEQDEEAYIQSIKSDMDVLFAEIDYSNNLYLIKKSVRKILRTVAKHIRYSGQEITEAELLLYFCQKLKASGIPLQNSIALSNILSAQVKKLNKLIPSLHEDLQHDYSRALEKLN